MKNDSIILFNDSIKVPLSRLNTIKYEEIYRNEIRESLLTSEKNTVLEFFNSPLGIWILSTIVIGIVSFCYKKYQESQKNKAKKGKKINKISNEIDFRVRHVDRVLLNAKEALNRYKIESITYSYDLSEIRTSIGKVSVIFDLGGITKIACEHNSSSHLFRFYNGNVLNLPFRSSYKYSRFLCFSIIDLVRLLRQVKYNKRDKQSDYKLAEIKKDDIIKIESIIKKWKEKYCINDGDSNLTISKSEDLNDDILYLSKWLKSIHTNWDLFINNFQDENLLGDFDLK